MGNLYFNLKISSDISKDFHEKVMSLSSVMSTHSSIGDYKLKVYVSGDTEDYASHEFVKVLNVFKYFYDLLSLHDYLKHSVLTYRGMLAENKGECVNTRLQALDTFCIVDRTDFPYKSNGIPVSNIRLHVGVERSFVETNYYGEDLAFVCKCYGLDNLLELVNIYEDVSFDQYNRFDSVCQLSIL